MIDRWLRLAAEMDGKPTATLYGLHRLLQGLSGHKAGIFPYRVVAQPVGNPVLQAVRADQATEVRLVGATDPVTALFPRPAAVVQGRFAQGDQCYVAWVKGQFAGHIWIARERYTEDEVRGQYLLTEPRHMVWDYDVYVEPSQRGTRTLARLWKGVDEALAAEGVRWSVSRINRFNSESLRAHARLGAVALGWITVLQWGAIQLHLTGGTQVTRSAASGSWRSFAVDVAPPGRGSQPTQPSKSKTAPTRGA